MMEKEIHPALVFLYKFSTRGIIWPLLCGAAFGRVTLPFSTFISSFLGIMLAYIIMLIFPRIGNILFIILAGVSAYIGLKSSDNFWGIYSLILFAILLFRTLVMGLIRLKYPEQAIMLDMQYAAKQAERFRK